MKNDMNLQNLPFTFLLFPFKKEMNLKQIPLKAPKTLDLQHGCGYNFRSNLG